MRRDCGMVFVTVVGAVLLAASSISSSISSSPAVLADDDPGNTTANEAAAALPPAAAGTIDYAKDVKPILSKHCYACHGTDKQESGLRLHARTPALAGGDGGVAIKPGDVAASPLLSRVAGIGDDERMPPPDEGDPLSAKEVGVLRAWIEQGAKWPEATDGGAEHTAAKHWAYQAPVQAALPAVRDAAWSRSAIDRFVLARLDQENLRPSADLDRPQLLRRVSLDLVGLPPTIADVEAFVADESPDAFERAVDRLLASPRYGERWAAMWLDLARYADTQGYEKDNRRTIWRYRDWVIDAFNRNLPFDQFTIEQLAGDLLPDATPDQILATAFHRNTMTNTEGGTDDEEFRVAAVVDRVNTTWAVWMATTMGCCQCHSHKYDPFTQREYYQFLAILNQTEDRDNNDESPTMPMPTAAQRRETEQLHAALAEIEAQLNAADPQLQSESDAWATRLQGAIEWKTIALGDIQSKQGATLALQADGSILVGGERPANDVYTLAADGDWSGVTALRLETLPDATLPGQGSGRADDGNFVLSRFSASLRSADAPLAFASAFADFSQGDFAIAEVLASKDVAKSGWAVQPQVKTPHEAVFVLANPLPVDAGRLQVTLEHRYDQPYFTLGRFRLSTTRDAGIREKHALPAAVREALALPRDKRTDAHRAAILAHYRTIAPQTKTLRDEQAAIKKQLAAIEPPGIPILRELPANKQRTTRIMNRGNFLDLGDEVSPGVPATMHSPSGASPANRLDMARWLASAENPLFGRVLVNRLWERLFGVGIVETTEDFGTQGARPSHPELLDWLAVDAAQRTWDVKATLRRIVTSSVYRQTSHVTPELLERDSYNRLLARGPRVRLGAEMIRDQALAIGGLLSAKIHGPSVMPPQPDGVWRVVYSGDQWITPSDEDKYRRGLYTFWRRTSPYPSMVAFDAPSREFCVLRRPKSNTPLQALVTLNDPVYIEAAAALANRVLTESGATTRERITHAMRLCVSRAATDMEIDRIAALLASEQAHFAQDAEAAKKLTSSRGGGVPAGVEPAELAAWTVVANVLLNLDEVVTKG
ncbi:MAG: PSD1 and planctomycete cytochrome C domain-containing protein [Pirellulales bacterium]